MKRILIDLTDLESWQGHHGGTQRVVYGIAKQFFLQKDALTRVEYIAFSARDNSFYKTSLEPIYERTENQQTSSSNQPVQHQQFTLRARVKQAVRPYIPER